MDSPDNSLKELCFKETRKLGQYQEEGEVESKIVPFLCTKIREITVWMLTGLIQMIETIDDIKKRGLLIEWHS